MFYIKATPNEEGNHGNPMSRPFAGSVALPDELLGAYLGCKGFALPIVEDGVVTAVEPNQKALDAYEEEHPEAPVADPEPTTEEILNVLLGVSE